MGTNNIPSTFCGQYILSDRGAEDLANAIILQAVYDYRQALKNVVQNPESKNMRAKKAVIDKFFASEWCRILSNVNMVDVARRLEKEALDKYG